MNIDSMIIPSGKHDLMKIQEVTKIKCHSPFLRFNIIITNLYFRIKTDSSNILRSSFQFFHARKIQ